MNQKNRSPFATVKKSGIEFNLRTHFQTSTLPLPSPNGWITLDVFLKLSPRKYKYNAYNINSADVLSRSSILIEYERMLAAIALSLS
jgi:hypothetical protein